MWAALPSDIKLSGALTAPAVDLVATVNRSLAAPGVDERIERLDISVETDLSAAIMTH